MKKNRKAFASASLVLSVVVGEFLALRYYLHSILGARIGWGPLMVDADLLVPGIAAFYLFFFTVSRNELPSLRLRIRPALVHLSSLFCFVVLNFLYFKKGLVFPLAFSGWFWTLALSVFLSSFFLLIPVSFYFHKEEWPVLVLCVLMAFSVILAKHVREIFWRPILSWLSVVSCPLAKVFLPETPTCQIAIGNAGNAVLRIKTESLVAFIGKPCSGLDGLFFFANLSIVVWTRFRGALRAPIWMAATLAGLGLTFLLNSVRIGILFAVAHFYHARSAQAGLNTFEWLYHNHLGWVLYSAFAFAYFWFILPNENSAEERGEWLHAEWGMKKETSP